MKKESTEQALAVVSHPMSTVEVIASLARDPSVNVEHFAQLLALKEREDSKEAVAAFTQAFARLQKGLPHVTKDGTISMGTKGKMKFATFENLVDTVSPLLHQEGFSISFASRPVENGVLMICTLSHERGHSRTSEMQLPPDKGAGRNDLQAIGSARSYGKRYLMCDILNVVIHGEDNDANTAYPLTEEQLDKVERLLDACELTPQRKNDFKKYMGVQKVADIQQADFQKAVAALQGLLTKKEGAK